MTLQAVMAKWLQAIKYVDLRFDEGSAVRTAYNLVAAHNGEYAPEARPVLLSDRQVASGLFTPAALQSVFHPYLREAMSTEGLVLTGSYTQDLRRLIRHLVDNSKFFLSRSMTFGTPTAAVAGKGTIHRCTTDKYGFPLECTQAEVKYSRVLADHTSGASKHREIHRFYGKPRDLVPWERTGSGMTRDVEAVDALSSGILRNTSFEDNGATADNQAPSSTTVVDGFTLSAAASFKLRSLTTEIFRGFSGSDFLTLWALEMIASGSFTQDLALTNPSFAYDKDIPQFTGIRWKRNSSATGTITLRLGRVAVQVSVASGVNGVYNHLFIPTDESAYYRQFGNLDSATTSLKLSVEIPNLAVGTVTFDDLVHAPMVNVDGTFYLPVGNATFWQNDDQYDWTDAQTVEALFSFYLWLSLVDVGALQQVGSWIPTTATLSELTFPE